MVAARELVRGKREADKAETEKKIEKGEGEGTHVAAGVGRRQSVKET
jgi:hypothetical protein